MKKVKFTLLMIVAALGIMGVGYAAWNDTLALDAAIETGWLDIKLEVADSSDPSDTEDFGQNLHVGRTEASITDEGKKLEVEITNAYPGYSSQATFDIKNASTVPVKVKAVNIENDGGDALEIDTSDVIGEEIGVGESLEVELYNVVTEDAEQNTTYRYTVEIVVQQWNID